MDRGLSADQAVAVAMAVHPFLDGTVPDRVVERIVRSESSQFGREVRHVPLEELAGRASEILSSYARTAEALGDTRYAQLWSDWAARLAGAPTASPPPVLPVAQPPVSTPWWADRRRYLAYGLTYLLAMAALVNTIMNYTTSEAPGSESLGDEDVVWFLLDLAFAVVVTQIFGGFMSFVVVRRRRAADLSLP